MLTCYGDRVRLPQSDLVYVAFRLAALDTLCQMEACQEPGDEDEGPAGVLAEVPFLAQVAPAVQVDLLADVWRRHRDPALHEASLLDAAVVYSVFRTAGRVIRDELDLVGPWLEAGPRQVRCRLGRRTPGRLDRMFFEFWDDVDFLSLDELQDLSPEHAEAVRELMRLPEGAVEEMEAALTRWRASPSVLSNLGGLLSPEEITDYSRFLVRA